MAAMRDNADLNRRAADLKQALLMALKQANQADLDGTRDIADLQVLAQALVQVKRARDGLDLLLKRLEFHVTLERIASNPANDDASRQVIGLVRLGVDGGYDVADVRRMVDQALGR
jgi:hypothetical protein